MENTLRKILPSFSYHNKILAFFNLVVDTCNGRWQIFIGQVLLSCKNFPVFSATRQNSLQHFIDQSVWLDSRLWSRAPDPPLNDVIRTSILLGGEGGWVREHVSVETSKGMAG